MCLWLCQMIRKRAPPVPYTGLIYRTGPYGTPKGNLSPSKGEFPVALVTMCKNQLKSARDRRLYLEKER